MGSRVDSLHDIFGPSDSKDAGTRESTNVASSTSNLEEFDDIFGGSVDAVPRPPGGRDTSENKATDVDEASSAGGNAAAAAASLHTADFDNIFGDAPPVAEPQASTNKQGKQKTDAEEEEGGDVGVETNKGVDVKGGASAASGATVVATAAASAAGDAAGADREFLNFLYEDDRSNKGAAPTNSAPMAVAASPAVATALSIGAAVDEPSSAGDDNSESGSPLGEEASFLETPQAAPGQVERTGVSSPTSQFDSVPLGSPPLGMAIQGADETGIEGGPAAANAPAASSPASRAAFVRKEKVEVLRPLPDDPASALRELMVPDTVAGTAGSEEQGSGESTDDVGYVRRLCAATGGFLQPDLRPVVWSLLLGLGRKPEDAGFNKWREERRSNPSMSVAAATSAYKLDLRNDCLALARRLCVSGGGEAEGADGEAGSVGGNPDPEVLAVDIEEVRVGCVWQLLLLHHLLSYHGASRRRTGVTFEQIVEA